MRHEAQNLTARRNPESQTFFRREMDVEDLRELSLPRRIDTERPGRTPLESGQPIASFDFRRDAHRINRAQKRMSLGPLLMLTFSFLGLLAMISDALFRTGIIPTVGAFILEAVSILGGGIVGFFEALGSILHQFGIPIMVALAICALISLLALGAISRKATRMRKKAARRF